MVRVGMSQSDVFYTLRLNAQFPDLLHDDGKGSSGATLDDHPNISQGKINGKSRRAQLIEMLRDSDGFMSFLAHFISFLLYEIYANKKASRLGGFFLSTYYFSCFSCLGQCPPRLAGRRAKEKEEKAKAANLSMHF
jgi:hypothetical protein